MADPFNIRILDPQEYIVRKNALPVTSHSMFEAASTRFHPEGLFSEVIFGQVGSKERLVKRGYMDLHTTIITPHLFKQIMSLKNFYKEVASGRTYAYFDPELKDLVKTTADDPKGNTGYSYFLKMLEKIEFPQTNSSKRRDKISLIDKYRDQLYMKQIIVLPAGVRDVKEDAGRMVPEEINKIYNSLLSLTEAMPQKETDDPIYDPIRFQIQMKVQAIYVYICDLLDGKGGFGQAKYAARAVTYSNRNVITAPIISRVDSPDGPDMFSADEVMVPLFQAMKGAVPLIINKLKTIFFDQVFGSGATQVPLIDSETHKLQYQEVSSVQMKRFTSSAGVEEIINEFRNNNIHRMPVAINTGDKEYYLYLVYDTGENIYIFRNKEEFIESYSNVRNFSSNNAENLDRLEGLNKEDYIIIGSTALAMYGMVHHNQDIDILVTEEMMKSVRKDPEFEKQKNNVYRKKDGSMDVYNDLIFEEEQTSFAKYRIDNTILIDGYHVNSPLNTLQTYQRSNRPKDFKKIAYVKSIVPLEENIRPLTYLEMCYLATFSALKDKHATSTRHPVLNLAGLAVFKVHVTSTSPKRVVHLRSLGDVGFESKDIVLPDYPILTETTKTSMSVHPSTLGQYGGDHDGDMLGLNILLSEEANAEMREFMSKPISMVSGDGSLIYGLADGAVVQYQLFATSYHPLPE